MVDLLILLTLTAIGFIVGGYNERRHYRRILDRERHYAQKIRVRMDVTNPLPAADGFLVVGSISVAMDYFKSLAAALRNLLGGRVSAFESLLDRARREAILRCQERAIQYGAQEIVNLRIETSEIGGGGIEVIAYGTALKHQHGI